MRDQESGGNLQSVRRALFALELISEHGELGVTELGRKLGVHKATASRLIATLAERGFVERDPLRDRRFPRRDGGLCSALQQGANLSRQLHHQLVPDGQNLPFRR